MASESWVGFARSPKSDKNLVRARHEATVISTLSLVDLFRLATSAEGMSSWLAPVSSAVVQTSGKIRFAQDSDFGLALFSSVELGKRAIINSENFGEIDMKFSADKNGSTIKISFSKLATPESAENFTKLAGDACKRLREASGA